MSVPPLLVAAPAARAHTAEDAGAARPPGRRLARPAAAVLLVLAVLAGASGAGAAAPCWPPPVEAPVADPFRLPACRWCPGNRGIEYATPAGLPVRAVATGRVTYRGTIDGTSYLVVRDARGWRVTYGNLAGLHHGRGDLVVAGTVVGRTVGPFHLGLRVGDDYVDPKPYLGRLVGRPRLIPVSGAPAAPAPPSRPSCA